MEIRTSSWELSKQFDVPHRNIRKAVESCMKDLIGVDLVYQAKNETSGRSRPVKSYHLTYVQWFHVTLRLRDTENQVKLKIYICNKILI